ncbi:hypothetical protein J2X47_000448 [Sphingomonas sp. BE270]|jgi:hypothetical protein|uniref:lasso peptide biosynthesis B2 protein n=1 Tax=Sphingomonas sp. BE270 TaxID=2817726 RepID=UPI002861E89D|nr:lasso peptide biosynthesis B2 protein [Sphingomonas sp. BE270]MDR7256287.1 hypothetical protein [Sphingomonas sp. BE270]
MLVLAGVGRRALLSHWRYPDVYRLRDQLHYCYSGGRAIFLDATDGRYFCLPATGETAFLAFHKGDANDDQVGWLRSKNILIEPDGRLGHNSPSTRGILVPSEQLEFLGRPTALDIMAATMARVMVQALLKHRGFEWAYRSVIAAKAKHGSTAESDDSQDPAAIAAAFQATDLLMGNTNRCLPRSLAFLRLCITRGHLPSLVLGVRTNPFTAHAWVQIGNKVLNDTVDKVRVFTPILVL